MATFRRISKFLRATALTVVATTIASCGGSESGATGGGAKSPGTAPQDEPQRSSSGSPNDSDLGGSTEPEADPCADGTCFRCGDSICPNGYYCDESNQACSWLAECADSADCACVTGALDGCQCDEKSGGVYVTCAD